MGWFRRKKNDGNIPSVSQASTPTAVTLKKAQDGLEHYIVRLKKENEVDLSQHHARVFVVIDRSGSMSALYCSGEVQKVLTRLLPLALKFDDNGELDVYVFNNTCTQLAPMTLKNYENYVQNEILNKGKGPIGGTSYAPVIKETVSAYNDDSPYPAFGIFITDGENDDHDCTDKAIRESSKHKIFYQFVGIGYQGFSYLQKLDDLDGREVDNTAFIEVKNFSCLDDYQMFNKLLEQYPQWLQAMHLN